MRLLTLRNKYNNPIGWIDDDGSQLKAYHMYKNYCGWYNKANDITFTTDGNIFCYGNGLETIIREVDSGVIKK